MLIPSNTISIGQYTFKRIVEVTVNSSYESMTSTATIKIPHRLQFKGKQVLRNGRLQTLSPQKIDNGDAIFKVGDLVLINIGYTNNETNVFRGYVTGISSGLPIQLTCEDEMWLLKQVIVGGSTGAVGDMLISKFLDTYLPASAPNLKPTYNIKGLENFKINFRSQGNTVVELFRKLKDDTGILTFYRNGVLTMGFPRDLVQLDKVTVSQTVQKIGGFASAFNIKGSFYFGKSIISDQLIYANASDYRIKVKGIALMDNPGSLPGQTDAYLKGTPDWIVANPDGTDDPKEGLIRGDGDGIEITEHFWKVGSKQELEDMVNQVLQAYKYTGYRGSFTTFGHNIIKFMDVISIVNLLRNDRPAGNYMVRGVKYTSGGKGVKQEIMIDIKV